MLRASSPIASGSCGVCSATRAFRRRHKLLLGAVVGYLALPFDLVPDFLPVVGQVDDVLVVWLALRVVLGGSGSGLLRQHWRGPESSLAIVLRFAGAHP